MTVLDQITQMRTQGISTSQIIQTLKEQGFSPRDINEALSQSEIKTELTKTQNPPVMPEQRVHKGSYTSQIQPVAYQDMQPSSYSQEYFQQQDNQNQDYQGSTNPQEISAEYQVPQEKIPEYEESEQPLVSLSQQFDQQNPSQYSQIPQYEYPQYVPQQSFDLTVISDITTQIIDEKIKDIKKEIALFSKFRKQVSEQIKEIETKINKIEDNLDNLQISIIRKIGDYGEDMKNISKELRATQDSFSKIINPLTDNFRELQNIKSKNPQNQELNKNQNKKTNEENQKDSFEDYLR